MTGQVVVGESPDGSATFGAGEDHEASLAPAEGLDAIFIARYSPDGELIWAALADGPGRELVRGLTVTSDGGAVIAGSFTKRLTFARGRSEEQTLASRGADDIFVAKHSAAGALVWARRAGGKESEEYGASVAALPNGGALVTGAFIGEALFDGGSRPHQTVKGVRMEDLFLAHYDRDGSLLRLTTIGTLGSDLGLGVAQLTDGGAVITGCRGEGQFSMQMDNGVTLGLPGQLDIYVARLDRAGATAWSRSAGGEPYTDCASAVTVLADDSTVVVGGFSHSATFGTGEDSQITLRAADESYDDLFIARYGADGKFAGVLRAGGSSIDAAKAVAGLRDGTVVVTGVLSGDATFGSSHSGVRDSASGEDFFLARVVAP